MALVPTVTLAMGERRIIVNETDAEQWKARGWHDLEPPKPAAQAVEPAPPKRKRGQKLT